MLDFPGELSKLHIGPCDTLWRIQDSNRRFHASGNNHFRHRKVGCSAVAADLAASLHLGLGLAEHAAHLRRWCGARLPGVMVPATLAGF